MIRATPIRNCTNACPIFRIRYPVIREEQEEQLSLHSVDCLLGQNNSQSESKLKGEGSTTKAAVVKVHMRMKVEQMPEIDAFRFVVLGFFEHVVSVGVWWTRGHIDVVHTL